MYSLEGNPQPRWLLGFIAIMGLIVGGCSSASDDQSEGMLQLGVPQELAQARLIYHRPDGVYLMQLSDGTTRRLVEQASYGRWSPDGTKVAMVRDNEVLVHDWQRNETRTLSRVDHPRAVGFHPSGREVYFTDHAAVRAVDLESGVVRQILSGPEFFELDISNDGSFMASTVRTLGYRVRRYELPTGTYREVSRGCSAGVSPSGHWITVNAGGHQQLALRDSINNEIIHTLHAPEGHTLNNHKWSNRDEWIVGIVQEPAKDIMVQRVPDGKVWRLTDHGDADRPDLFIP